MEELEFLRERPTMRVKPYGENGETFKVSECDSAELESVARRNVERAVERAIRSNNATTQA